MDGSNIIIYSSNIGTCGLNNVSSPISLSNSPSISLHGLTFSNNNVGYQSSAMIINGDIGLINVFDSTFNNNYGDVISIMGRKTFSSNITFNKAQFYRNLIPLKIQLSPPLFGSHLEIKSSSFSQNNGLIGIIF